MVDRLAAALADRYRVVREAGAGGMATVYLAEDLKHGREVALKVLRPELAATMGPERFVREIQLAARLQHPHILPMHDSGEADGVVYFVMPFVHGESLRARLEREGELPVPEAVRIASQVVDALSHAHAQGVVHRDIKPDNVMLAGRHAMVTDFGVAKAVREAAAADHATTAGMALGTPAYMAPEQAAADPVLDHRVDVYAVGVLLYEMLTGRTPFHGRTPAQLLAAQVSETPVPVRTLREACPPALEQVVMRCLAKRPADRWQSAEELLQALEPLTASSGGVTPTQLRPAATGDATGAATAPRNNSRLVAAFGGVAVVAAAIAWTLRAGGDTASREIPLGSLERVRVTNSGWARSGAISRDGNRVAFFERRCDSDDACTTDLRVQDVGGAGSSVLVAGLDFGGTLDWAPDGRWLTFEATVGGRYGVWLVPTLGGAPTLLGCCAATFTGRGDTLLLVEQDGSDTARALVRLSAASPGTRERVTLGDPRLRSTFVVREVRDDRLAAVVLGVPRSVQGRSAHIYLLDRAGAVLDSVPVDGALPARSMPQRTATGLWVLHEDQAGRRQVSHLRWTSRGSLDPVSTAVVRDVPTAGGISMTPDGVLMGGEGTREAAAWAVERDSPESMALRYRLATRSTSSITGSITPDGSHLLLARERPSDPRVMEFSLAPFSGGAERAVGVLEDAYDWDILPDSRRVHMLQRTERGETKRLLLDLTTGATTPLDTEARNAPFGHEFLAGGGYVYLALGDSLGVRDLPGRRDTAFTIRGMLATGALPPAGSPDGRRVALTAWLTSLDTLAVLSVDLETGELQRHADIKAEGGAGTVWLPSGELLVAVIETETTQAWWLVPTDGRPARRLGVPPRSDGTYRFSDDGRRAILREQVMRSDISIWRGLPANHGR